MGKRIDLTGQRFGRLVVEKQAGTRNGHVIWKCKCDCGKEVITVGLDLRRGKTKSCGCLRDEMSGNRNRTHGKTQTRLYAIWHSMVERVENSNNKDYKDYGGRGIAVCQEWKDSFCAFYNWSMQNGYSDDLSIDRIDNNGGYEPENCRWATQHEQANNKRTNTKITYNNLTLTTAEWAKKVGMNRTTLTSRIFRLGWPIDKAIETKVRKKMKK